MSHAVHKAKLKQSIKHGKLTSLFPFPSLTLPHDIYLRVCVCVCVAVCVVRKGALRCQVVREVRLLQFVIMKLCNDGYE